MRECNIPTLVQIMACRMFGTKPLCEPMLPYCQLDPKEHISMKFYSKFKIFIHGNTPNMSAKRQPFCLSVFIDYCDLHTHSFQCGYNDDGTIAWLPRGQDNDTEWYGEKRNECIIEGGYFISCSVHTFLEIWWDFLISPWKLQVWLPIACLNRCHFVVPIPGLCE